MLYTTKRKLHNLLHGPNQSPSPVSPLPSNASSMSPQPQPPATPKKQKLTTSDTPLSARPSIRAVSPAVSVRSTRSTGSALRSENPKSSFSYAPWDRAQFLDRLSSFRFVDKWSAKPAPVNEVAWAKRGWICNDKDRVRCTVCSKEVPVKVQIDDEQTDEGRAVIERFASMIVDEHDDNCLWRKRGCDDTIYRLQLVTTSVARQAFVERYISLVKVRDEIPPNLSSPPEADLAAIHFPSDATDEGPIFEAAAMLAMFGWQNEDPGIPSLVTCSACFRRLGLWLFRQKAGTDEEASVCRLDVVGEHRDYCPWINPASQGKDPGWKIMLRALRQNMNSSSGASVYSVASHALDRELTPAERDAEEEGKLKKLKRLKSLYFGKKASTTKSRESLKSPTKSVKSLGS